MNTSEKVVEVRAVHDRGWDQWLVLGVMALIGSALAAWAWWLFD